MAFVEDRISTKISYGSSGGPGFSTFILTTDSGAEERSSRWQAARRRYNVVKAIQDQSDLSDLVEFYIARRGPAVGFRFKDWMDYSTSSDHISAPDDEDVEIGVGDASETEFQIFKEYTSGGVTRNRNITKPVADSTVIAIDGVAKTAGADFTVDTTTGIVTFAAAPGNGEVVSAGCEFDVPVRFGEELDLSIAISIDTWQTASISDVPLIEIRDELANPEEFFFGGGAEISITALTVISLGIGRALKVTSDGSDIKLPASADFPTGGPFWFIYNDAATGFDVLDEDDNPLITLAQDESVTIYNFYNGSSNEWLGVG